MSVIIDYRNVEVDRAERMVLHDVTFQISEGEFCYLVGRVGSGKSSLMKTMYAGVPVPWDSLPAPQDGHRISGFPASAGQVGHGQPALCAGGYGMEIEIRDGRSHRRSVESSRYGQQRLQDAS